MRIYAEVIWQWDDTQGKLVETSSKSEEYSGCVDLCKKGQWKEWHIGYDDAGNEYSIKAQDAGWGKWDGAQMYVRKWDATAKKHGDKQTHGGTYSRIKKVRNVTGTGHNVVKALTERGQAWGTFEEVPNMKGIFEGSDVYGTDDQSRIKETVSVALKNLTEEWQDIASQDPSRSEYQRAIDASFDTLARAGEGQEGETYTDPITGEELPITGAIGTALADYETSVEGTERGRETGLRAARGAYSPAIRQAEAAAAATGFAGTGAGEAARAELAEEFITEVGDVEAETTATREAAGAAFGGAQADFAQTKATHEQTVTGQQLDAQRALKDLQISMEESIRMGRDDLDDKSWNPFADVRSSVSGTGEDYGWEDPVFNPTRAEQAVYSEDEGEGLPTP